MPFLIWPAVAAFFGGAFIGAQVDDKNDPVPNPMGTIQVPSAATVLMYGAGAVGLYLVYKKVMKA